MFSIIGPWCLYYKHNGLVFYGFRNKLVCLSKCFVTGNKKTLAYYIICPFAVNYEYDFRERFYFIIFIFYFFGFKTCVSVFFTSVTFL
jgi:hypothetical protein